jgi:hypothetical protein
MRSLTFALVLVGVVGSAKNAKADSTTYHFFMSNVCFPYYFDPNIEGSRQKAYDECVSSTDPYSDHSCVEHTTEIMPGC